MKDPNPNYKHPDRSSKKSKKGKKKKDKNQSKALVKQQSKEESPQRKMPLILTANDIWPGFDTKNYEYLEKAKTDL